MVDHGRRAARHFSFALLLVGSLPGAALAQATQAPEPSLPSNPTSPTDFNATGTLPQAGAATAGTDSAGDTATGGAATGTAPVAGYSGGDNVLDYDDPNRPQVARQIPEYHVVKEGDTLWSLCDHYYSDPWAWPRLWAKNRSVTNPHWIYPGDKIRMIGGQPMARATGKQRRPAISVARSRLKNQGPLMLSQLAFVDQDELKNAGRIVGAPRAALLLSPFHQIYVGGEKFRVQRGHSYSIYRYGKSLNVRGKSVGRIVEIVGTARVLRISDKNVATAVITQANGAITRDCMVGPLRRVYKPLPVTPATVDMDATLFAALSSKVYLARDDVVFIDRGSNDGVRVGNRFLLVRQEDGYRRVVIDEGRADQRLPEGVVAEVGVLDMRDSVAIGMVTRATTEIRVGEKLRLRRGY
ncbi:MAG: LysM peptidoglycan-binding domain-containing protein [Deltaproteobacteria bacterium]|nr:LysM peptidoglycan-binding domain-containing protein [Deltaproteobacteria bacterium]